MKRLTNLEIFLAIIVVLVVVSLFLFGLNQNNQIGEKSCKTDSDCACGVDIRTGGCFYGNRNFVDTTRQCPDFCNGIAANFIIVCSNNTCVQKNVRI